MPKNEIRTPLLSLDYTLDSGQAFRWKKKEGWWIGILGKHVVRLRQKGSGMEVDSDISSEELWSYFRLDDDLEKIYEAIAKDEYMKKLIEKYKGLRILRQDTWETSASYILATHASVPQIMRMINNLCQMYGKPLGHGYFSFPRPEDIVEDESGVLECKLGFRAGRVVRFAKGVASGEVDLERLKAMDYEPAFEYLNTIYGIGPKVADCISLFGLGHMEAFPVDVRIARAMENQYGVKGNYKKVNAFGRRYFGPWAGYAQEYIYISEARSRKQETEEIRRCTPGKRNQALLRQYGFRTP